MARRVFLRFFIGCLGIAGLLAAQTTQPSATESESPVVLELFTSQGCSSCPKADELLGYIAAMREDVLALSFHVDYWNYIGWKDRFATEKTTARQKAYARTLGLSYVYTPQLVVNGQSHVVGSDENKVVQAIEVAHSRAQRPVGVTLRSRPDGGLEVSITGQHFDGNATVWLVNFDREHTTDVDAGENMGRTLVNHHVVRGFRRIGTWSGPPETFSLSAQEVAEQSQAVGDGCAVLVQADNGTGAIIGARAVWMAAAE